MWKKKKINNLEEKKDKKKWFINVWISEVGIWVVGGEGDV